jgi:hypothetical protein
MSCLFDASGRSSLARWLWRLRPALFSQKGGALLKQVVISGENMGSHAFESFHNEFIRTRDQPQKLATSVRRKDLDSMG